MKIIGVKGVQELLGVSRDYATHILNMKSCPTLPRRKNQAYKIFDEDLIEWVRVGGLRDRR